MKRLIISAGFAVDSFVSAQGFRARPRPDISARLVLGIHVPGVSGLDLEDELAIGGGNLPLIFLTVYGTVPGRVRGSHGNVKPTSV